MQRTAAVIVMPGAEVTQRVQSFVAVTLRAAGLSDHFALAIEQVERDPPLAAMLAAMAARDARLLPIRSLALH